jgi:2-dehydropantoate 2-reductase
VGRERVLLGFAVAGGVREGTVVRYLAFDAGPGLVFGELDGSPSARAQQIAAAFRHAGIDVTISPSIDAWLKTHWAIVGPLAYAVYACDGDVYRVARTRDARVLIVRAMREGLRVLRDQGIPTVPGSFRLIQFVPETVLILLLARLVASERAEIAVEGHANAARDEMAALTEEFRAFKHRGEVWTPALDRLTLYLDPAMPVLPEGAATMPLSWQGTFAMLVGLLVAFNILSNIGAYLLGHASGRKRRA